MAGVRGALQLWRQECLPLFDVSRRTFVIKLDFSFFGRLMTGPNHQPLVVAVAGRGAVLPRYSWLQCGERCYRGPGCPYTALYGGLYRVIPSLVASPGQKTSGDLEYIPRVCPEKGVVYGDMLGIYLLVVFTEGYVETQRRSMWWYVVKEGMFGGGCGDSILATYPNRPVEV